MYIVHIQRPCKSIRSCNSYQEGIRFHPILRDQMILGFYTNFFFFFWYNKNKSGFGDKSTVRQQHLSFKLCER